MTRIWARLIRIESLLVHWVSYDLCTSAGTLLNRNQCHRQDCVSRLPTDKTPLTYRLPLITAYRLPTTYRLPLTDPYRLTTRLPLNYRPYRLPTTYRLPLRHLPYRLLSPLTAAYPGLTTLPLIAYLAAYCPTLSLVAPRLPRIPQVCLGASYTQG
jgi:hypothetical protein